MAVILLSYMMMMMINLLLLFLLYILLQDYVWYIHASFNIIFSDPEVSLMSEISVNIIIQSKYLCLWRNIYHYMITMSNWIGVFDDQTIKRHNNRWRSEIGLHHVVKINLTNDQYNSLHNWPNVHLTGKKILKTVGSSTREVITVS